MVVRDLGSVENCGAGKLEDSLGKSFNLSTESASKTKRDSEDDLIPAMKRKLL